MPQRSTHHRPSLHRSHRVLAAEAAVAAAAVGISGLCEASVCLSVQGSR